jgi:hypothetical protein
MPQQALMDQILQLFHLLRQLVAVVVLVMLLFHLLMEIRVVQVAAAFKELVLAVLEQQGKVLLGVQVMALQALETLRAVAAVVQVRLVLLR